jgi:hypothetical protein
MFQGVVWGGKEGFSDRSLLFSFASLTGIAAPAYRIRIQL